MFGMFNPMSAVTSKDRKRRSAVCLVWECVCALSPTPNNNYSKYLLFRKPPPPIMSVFTLCGKNSSVPHFTVSYPPWYLTVACLPITVYCTVFFSHSPTPRFPKFVQPFSPPETVTPIPQTHTTWLSSLFLLLHVQYIPPSLHTINFPFLSP